MGWVVKFQAQQTILHPVTGAVLVESGDETDDPSVLGPGSVYVSVARLVEDPPPKPKPPEQHTKKD